MEFDVVSRSMANHIFVSYSHKDEDKVAQICEKLISLGFTLWRDRDALLPGQDWEFEISKAMRSAAGALVFISRSWVTDRSYVNKELRELVNILGQYPTGKVFIVPVRLDDSESPESLKHIQWIDVEPNGMAKIEQSLRLLTKPDSPTVEAARARSVSGWEEMMEELISSGAMKMFEIDPWKTGTPDVVAFKDFLKPRLTKTFELQKAQQWKTLIDLWNPARDNPLFDVSLDYWRDKPFFRVYILTGYSALFQAHAMAFRAEHGIEHFNEALRLLDHLLDAPSYSLKGASSERLDTETAEIQNLNFRDVLEFAKSWLTICGWPRKENEIELVLARAENKIAEINFMLRRKNPQNSS